jgi:hypothetical protein
MSTQDFRIQTPGIAGSGAMGRRNIHRVLGNPRYRPSPWLARRASPGLSLTHIEELR